MCVATTLETRAEFPRARSGSFGTIPLWRGVCRDRPDETPGRIPEYLSQGALRAVDADTLGPIRDYL